MEESSNKRKIETTRWIWFNEVVTSNWKKSIKPWISKNIKSISIENPNSNEYNPNAKYLKDLKVEIIWTEWHSDTLLNFIKNI